MAKLNFFNKYRSPEFQAEQDKIKKKMNKFSVFIVVAVLIVTIITGSIFYINYKNNTIRMFVDASSATFDCGSFDFVVDAKINGESNLSYKGSMEFDLQERRIMSKYHAKYNEYEYDSATYVVKGLGINGAYYGGKWTVVDYTSTSMDFFDFYKSYRENKFNAAAFMRFMGDTKTFDAVQLTDSVHNIVDELSSTRNLNNVMNQDVKEEDENIVVTFEPELDEVFNIIVDNIASAYSSANEYQDFKKKVKNSQETLKNTKCKVSYTINKDGYLSDLSVEYTVGDVKYDIVIKLSNFRNATVTIPDDFYVAANSQM